MMTIFRMPVRKQTMEPRQILATLRPALDALHSAAIYIENEAESFDQGEPRDELQAAIGRDHVVYCNDAIDRLEGIIRYLEER